MPSPTADRVVRPGWEHRAFLGVGPFGAEDFEAKLAEHAAANGWGDAEAAARAAQAYEVAGATRKEVTA